MGEIILAVSLTNSWQTFTSLPCAGEGGAAVTGGRSLGMHIPHAFPQEAHGEGHE